MTFGEKLQKLRAREGLSQDALSELLDVSRQAVSKWERDEAMPEAEKLVRISDCFAVTIDSLLRPDGSRRHPCARPPGAGRCRSWRSSGGSMAACWPGPWQPGGVWRCIRMVARPGDVRAGGHGQLDAVGRRGAYYLMPGLSVALCGVLTAWLVRRGGGPPPPSCGCGADAVERPEPGRALRYGPGGLVDAPWVGCECGPGGAGHRVLLDLRRGPGCGTASAVLAPSERARVTRTDGKSGTAKETASRRWTPRRNLPPGRFSVRCKKFSPPP